MDQISSFNGLRFFVALVIILFHIGNRLEVYPFRYGSLAVEFFFILSGFLLAKTYEKMISSSSIHKNTPTQLCKMYFFHRFNRLWPEYFLAVIVSFVLLNAFLSAKIQPFFLNAFMMSGWGNIHIIMAPLWFVPVLFWCSCLLFNLLVIEKEKCKTIFFPLIAIFCLFCAINAKELFTNAIKLALGYLSNGIIRGVLALIVGIYTYWGCQALKACKINWRPRFVAIALFIGEVISVIGLGYIFIFQKKFTMNLFNVYFYASFLIGLLYFQKEKLLKFLSWKIWIPFSAVSYSLYLVHGIVIRIFVANLKVWINTHAVLWSVLTILLSLALAFFCHYTQLGLRKVLKKLALKQ